jgi:hypothetical protein
MDLNAPVVVNKAQFPEFIHEETHTGPRGANHFSKRFLADFRDHGFRYSFLAEICQQQEEARETLFAGIEELVDKVRLNTNASAQEVSDEFLRERWLLVNHVENS